MSGPTESQLRSRQKLLYVEDEPDNFSVAKLRLGKTYDLTWADTDRKACELLRSEGASFAAILMDIELKGSTLDGRGLMQVIRGTRPRAELPSYALDIPVLPSTPIIVVTAYGDRFSAEELTRLGATNSMAKPVNFVSLSLAIANACIRAATQAMSAPKR